MRFFQRRREKDADWLQQMEGNWSDRHGSCYEAGWQTKFSRRLSMQVLRVFVAAVA